MKSYQKKLTAAGLLLACLALTFTACGGSSNKPIPPEVTALTWTMTNAILGDPENQNIPRDVYTAPNRSSADADRNESYQYTLIVAFPPDSGIPEFHFSAPVEE